MRSFCQQDRLICALQSADFLRQCWSQWAASRTISFSFPISFFVINYNRFCGDCIEFSPLCHPLCRFISNRTDWHFTTASSTSSAATGTSGKPSTASFSWWVQSFKAQKFQTWTNVLGGCLQTVIDIWVSFSYAIILHRTKNSKQIHAAHSIKHQALWKYIWANDLQRVQRYRVHRKCSKNDSTGRSHLIPPRRQKNFLSLPLHTCSFNAVAFHNQSKSWL